MNDDTLRLRALWDKKAPMSQRAFGQAYGLGTPGMVNQYLTGRAPLNLRCVTRFAEGLGVRIEDISPTLAAEAQRSYRSIDRTQAVINPPRAIPLLSHVQAGAFTEVGQADYDETVAGEDWMPEGCFALSIKGDSMTPRFREGDVIIVNPELHPRPGDFVVARAEGENSATFKQYALTGRTRDGTDTFDLVPLNPMYPRLHSTDMQIWIQGVAIQHRARLR